MAPFCPHDHPETPPVVLLCHLGFPPTSLTFSLSRSGPLFYCFTNVAVLQCFVPGLLLPLPILLRVTSSIVLSLSHQGDVDDSQTSVSSTASFSAAGCICLYAPAPQTQHALPTNPPFLPWIVSPFTQMLNLKSQETGCLFGLPHLSHPVTKTCRCCLLLALRPGCFPPFPLCCLGTSFLHFLSGLRASSLTSVFSLTSLIHT